MKKIILKFSLLIVSLTTYAQPSVQWKNVFGGTFQDDAYSVQQTTDGGFIIAGYTNSNNGDVTGNNGGTDFWVVKLNSIGAIQWQKALGGTLGDAAFAIEQTFDGGYIVAGQSSSNDGDVSGHHGSTFTYDYWVVKLDSFGTIQWQKSLGGTGYDAVTSIQQTDDSGYIVAGQSSSNNDDVTGHHGATYDYWIVKLNSIGTIVWQKSLGGADVDVAYSIQQTTDNGYIVAGNSYSIDGDVSSNIGSSDCWIVKLDFTGSIQWEKSYGGTQPDFAYSVKQTFDGGYIFGGQSYSIDGDVTSNQGQGDYWVVKLDSTGIIQWQKSYGGTGDEFVYSLQQTSDGGYILGGSSDSINGDILGTYIRDYWLVKIDTMGTIEWQKSLGGTNGDWANCIQQTSDNGYIVAGFTYSNDGDIIGNNGNSDFWIVKLNALFTENVEKMKENNFKIYPNPFSNSATIEISTEHKIKYDFILYDQLGREVKKMVNITEKKIVFEKDNLNSGMYFYKAISSENIIGGGKLIIN